MWLHLTPSAVPTTPGHMPRSMHRSQKNGTRGEGGIVYKAKSFCLVLQYCDPKVLSRDAKEWTEGLAKVQDRWCVHGFQQVV